MRAIVATGLVTALFTGAAVGCSFSDGDRAGFFGNATPPPKRDGGTRPSPPTGPQPDFGPTVMLSDAPPPLSGGTLLVSRDGARAVAADPDRDRVYVVDLATKKVDTITLETLDEPGRIVEDGEGRFHVALRRGGAIVTITPSADGIPTTERRPVCAAPRGLGFDVATQLMIACEGGELVRLPAAGGPPTLLAQLERDLRDVVITDERVFVSTFRSARLLELSHEGALITSGRLAAMSTGPMRGHEPMIAFRMIAAPAGQGSSTPVIVHETAQPGALSTGTNSYYGTPRDDNPCGVGSVVRPAITRAGSGGGTLFLPHSAVLPVDVATDGKALAIIAAGNGHTQELPQLFLMTPPSSSGWSSPCDGEAKGQRIPGDFQLTAVAFRGPGAVVVQSREPARLVLLPEGEVIPLSESPREDTGHAVFHSNAGVGAACASCHPEGGDDGHTWQFTSIGPRRTPSLRGTLRGTSPFHWDGDIDDIGHLADVILSGRMSGPSLDVPQKAALERWLFAIPGPKPSVTDDAAVGRGKAVFEREEVGCAGCHSGPMLASGAADVGTGGMFQIPSLIGVAARTPLMHDGCASTLRERFSVACGGDRHGSISRLTAPEIDDLIAYLESL